MPGYDLTESSDDHPNRKIDVEEFHVLSIWKQQFVDALTVLYCTHYFLGFIQILTEVERSNSF